MPTRIPNGQLSLEELIKARRLNNFRMTKDVMDDPEVTSALNLNQRNAVKALMDTAIANVEQETPTGPPAGRGAQISYSRANPAGTLVYEIRKGADLIDLDFINTEIANIDAELLLLDPITNQDILDELIAAFQNGDSPGDLFSLLNSRIADKNGIQGEIDGLTNRKTDLENLRDTVTAGL